MIKKYFLRLFIINLSVCFFLVNSSAQEYYPLQIGNRWDYKRTFSEPGHPSVIDTFSVEVENDSVFNNGKTYYILNRYDLAEGKILRADSSYIIYYDENEFDEDTLFRFNAEVGDYWFVDFGITFIVDLMSIDAITFFEFQTTVYEFKLDGLIQSFVWLSYKFGPIQYYSPGEPPGTSSTSILLLGCKIDSIQYGNPVSVNPEPLSLNEYFLSQNYPNPFNPSTKIRFTIPVTLSEVEGSVVTLKIYDVLGNEIVTLVNEEKPSGEYDVQFNGTGLTSGVYFYQLKAGNYIETKKMVLLR